LTLDRALEDTLPYLFALLGIADIEDPLAGMDAQIRKRRTLDGLKRLLLRESLNQPLIVIFEDLHWIDEETLAFLNLLADSIGTAKILLLVNYRPEYQHQWGSKSCYTQLRLHPLGKESAEVMLAALLGEGKDLIPLKRLIVVRTEGNPFFMEEMVQVLFDEGALVRDGAVVKVAKSLSELKIPPTVQGILAARIDRLPAGEKELIQMLAVIGKEFSLRLARAVGDIEYSFKHALTHEVAYNSVLIERRKAMHERIGAVAGDRQHAWTSWRTDAGGLLAGWPARPGNCGAGRFVEGCASDGRLSDSTFGGRTGLAIEASRRARGRSAFAPRDWNSASPGRQVVGVARDNQPRAAARSPGQA